MFRQTLTRVGVPTALAALLLMTGAARAQHGGGGHGGGGHGGGGRGGGFHGGGGHSGGFHGGGLRSGGFRSGGFRSGSFHPGGIRGGHFHPGAFRGGRFRTGVVYPSYYPFYGYYPSDNYYPSYDLGYGPAPDQGYFDSYGGVAPSDAGGYLGVEPSLTVIPDTAPAPADSTAHVTVRVPANAELRFDGSSTKTTGSVREFQSPPLSPGRYTYEIDAHWTENGRDVTQTQTVAVSPGAHLTVDFPIRAGTK